MRISKQVALQIVTELGDIIGQKVNLMDETGTIIASTDASRIGTVHGAAQKVIAQRRELIVTAADELAGTRPGVNLPLEMDGQIIGVVGITGEYADIEKHGRIIKKMTEILLMDDSLKEQKRLAKSVQARFAQEWIFDGSGAMGPAFESRGLAVGVDVSQPRRVAVFSPVDRPDTAEDQQRLERIEHSLRRTARSVQESLLVNSGLKFVCLLPELPGSGTDALVQRMCREAQEACGIALAAGLDDRAVCGADVHAAYLRAEKAMRSSLSREGHPLVRYRDIDLEIFIHEVPAPLKREFVDKIFTGCPPEERAQDILLLKTFFACDGSISQASEKLFLHKNTLQYKLNRLARRTGVNPRTLEGAALYYLAIAFEESLGQAERL